MRVLIVKTSALGDIVQTYPVVEYLKTRQKVKTVGWVVERRYASLVKAHPYVDEVIEIDSQFFKSAFSPFKLCKEYLRQREKIQTICWDVVFDVQANCKSGLCTWLASSPVKVGYGKQTVAEWPNILVTTERRNPPPLLSMREEYVWLARSHFCDDEPFFPTSYPLVLTPEEVGKLEREQLRWPKDTPVWVIAVGSTWPNKTCSTNTFLEILRSAKRKFSPYFIFIAGTGEELKEVERLALEFHHESHVLYHPELPVLQHIMERASAVVAVDSLLLHLAATTNSATFGIFGPSLAKKYAPVGKGRGYFQGSCPFNISFEKRCPFLRTCQEGLCLRGADPAQILDSFESWCCSGDV